MRFFFVHLIYAHSAQCIVEKLQPKLMGNEALKYGSILTNLVVYVNCSSIALIFIVVDSWDSMKIYLFSVFTIIT